MHVVPVASEKQACVSRALRLRTGLGLGCCGVRGEREKRDGGLPSRGVG